MPEKIKIVLVTMFEPAGELPGERTLFVKRLGLEPVVDTGCGLEGRLYRGGDTLLIEAGVGTANTAVSIMALGHAPQFDLSESLWLISGIAGINPNQASLGSVAWCDWCVDADLSFELDAREIEPGWSTGILPIGASEPYGKAAGSDGEFGERYECFQLDPKLHAWAMDTCAGLPMVDSEAMAKARAAYTGNPAALDEPKLLSGACISGARFWHGNILNAWAERWVNYWTGGQGTFVASAMEDTGTLLALRHLTKLGRADEMRCLLLRSGSNFTMPPPGKTAIENLTGGNDDGSEANYPGYMPALENGYAAAERVINAWAG